MKIYYNKILNQWRYWTKEDQKQEDKLLKKIFGKKGDGR